MNHKLFKEKRLEQKLTNRAVMLKLLEKGVNVTSQTIYNWENGKTKPSINGALALAEIYGISKDEII